MITPGELAELAFGRRLLRATRVGHDPMSMDRRVLLQGAAWFAAGSMLPDFLYGQEGDQGGLTPLNRFPRMVQEYFVQQVRQAERDSLRVKANLMTRGDAEAYVAAVRQKIRRCFGPEPDRTPLNAQITGVVERDVYRIEKVLFESRPGFFVSANLYLPNDAKNPRPGVVGTCGHSATGKAIDAYQSFAQGLARQGYVCLIYDPIGQGERLQYVDGDLKPRRGIGVAEHLYAGNQQFLVGEFFGAWRAWDGIRALDYLLSRPEVDGDLVGVTGNSGGGTMTTWLCGLEQRWAMAAPSCFVTTFRRNLENELPADTEQCPPRAIALGLDHDDFLAALAPHPIIILAKERDYFDVRGTQEAFTRLKRLYTLLGAEENIQLFVGPSYHGYSQENREAMYGWFNQVTELSDSSAEPDLVIEDESTLWCTPKGQVAGVGSKPIYEFTREKSEGLRQERGRVSGVALRNAITEVLKLPPLKKRAPDFRILRYLGGRRYPKRYAIAYAVETEPDLLALVYMLSDDRHYSRPPRAGRQALLYVAHQSSDAELREDAWLSELIAGQPDRVVFTCDVRGIGESQPDTCGIDSFHNPYGSDYFYAIHSLMLDRPYPGQRTYDVLRVLQWLGEYGYEDVHLVAKGWGALPATFAAVLSDRVTSVTLKNALTSFSAIAEAEQYNWPLSSFVPNILSHFDLPDCYAELGGKQLKLVDPWDQRAGTA